MFYLAYYLKSWRVSHPPCAGKASEVLRKKIPSQIHTRNSTFLISAAHSRKTRQQKSAAYDTCLDPESGIYRTVFIDKKHTVSYIYRSENLEFHYVVFDYKLHSCTKLFSYTLCRNAGIRNIQTQVRVARVLPFGGRNCNTLHPQLRPASLQPAETIEPFNWCTNRVGGTAHDNFRCAIVCGAFSNTLSNICFTSAGSQTRRDK